MDMKIIKLSIGFAIFETIMFMIGSICQAEENEICGVSAERLAIYKERIAQYAPMIQSTLKNYNVDEQFIWLAMMESGGSEIAVSKRGAAGLWQLTKSTAKHYGCEPNYRLDARCSTTAAAGYISKLLYDFDGDKWKAVVGYNMGGSNYKKVGKPTDEARKLANTVTCLMEQYPYNYSKGELL
jgi:soluble lytic murein transglycosylase-like protein